MHKLASALTLALLASCDSGVSPADDLADAGDTATAVDATAGDGDGDGDGDSDAADAGDDGPPACTPAAAGNPIVEGWYADPDMQVYDGVYWMYPTYSAPFDDQTFLDAFSSPDLVHWQKHERILDRSTVSWATRAVWAPSPIARNGKYYLYFGANDIQNDQQLGGIGVAVAAAPGGPFVDAIGAPLIGQFHNGAQPIDQNVFIDDDGQAYLYYGGWRHCNVVKLNADMISLGTHDDGSTYKEVTPAGYVEGALMFKRAGRYYFMWSEGGWTGPDYRVSYAIADSPLGPFATLGTILSQDARIATGSGHNTVVNVPGTDDWYIFYHRRPLGVTDGNHRVLSSDRLVFRDDGSIAPVEMTSQDDFCDDNALGWRLHGGNWVVHEKSFVAEPEAEAKATLNTHFVDLDYQARITLDAAGRGGLLFRVTQLGGAPNGYHGYFAGLDTQGKLVLGRADGTAFTELASAAQRVLPATTYVLRVVASGANIAVYLDRAAEPALTTSDATFEAGATGLLAAGGFVRFDDVVATSAP
jgi:hypothetical protein